MGEDDGSGDGEPEPGAARLPRAGGVQAHEGLEDPLGVGGGDADAGVLDREDGLTVGRPEREIAPCRPRACT